jgi:hypothetical protein
MIINDPTAMKAENQIPEIKEKKNGAYRTFWEETRSPPRRG